MVLCTMEVQDGILSGATGPVDNCQWDRKEGPSETSWRPGHSQLGDQRKGGPARPAQAMFA